MSCPTREVAKNLIERLEPLLREWDDNPYLLAIMREDGTWSYAGRGGWKDQLALVQQILAKIQDDAIEI